MCPGTSLGGHRLGIGLAKMSRVAQGKKVLIKKEGVLLAVMRFLEVSLGLWHPFSERAVETWQ